MAREQLYVPDALYDESWAVLGDDFNRSRCYQLALRREIDRRSTPAPMLVCEGCGARVPPGEDHRCRVPAPAPDRRVSA